MLKLNHLTGFNAYTASTGGGGGGGGGSGEVNAVDYGGTNDYLTRSLNLAGITTITQGIISVWYRIDGGDGTTREILISDAGTCRLVHSSSNYFYVSTSGGTGRVDYRSTAYTAGATWYHILTSWQSSPSRTQQLYVNDSSDLTAGTGYSDDGLPFTIAAPSGWAVGAGFGGSQKLNGALAELYFAPGQYLDFSVTGNRRKFITSLGKPENLGSDGSTPTGVAPALYLPNAAATINVNAGTGGDFVIHGAPTDASSNPSQ